VNGASSGARTSRSRAVVPKVYGATVLPTSIVLACDRGPVPVARRRYVVISVALSAGASFGFTEASANSVPLKDTHHPATL
jgi:hypothetical protein